MGDVTVRYEAVSVAWVNALRDHVASKFGGKKLGFTAAYAAQYTNPPAHLLRDDGRDTVGWTFRITDGKAEILDGAHFHGADVASIQAYEPVAATLRYTNLEMDEWNADNAARLADEGKLALIGAQRAAQVMMFIQRFRNEFLAKHTATNGDAPSGERYEPLSVAWIEALRQYFAERARGRDLGFQGTYSSEYRDAPPHLLRNGRDTAGWTIRVNRDKVEVLDGSNLNWADFASVLSYDPMAFVLGYTDEELMRWGAQNSARLEGEHKINTIGPSNVVAIATLLYHLRSEFFCKFTA